MRVDKTAGWLVSKFVNNKTFRQAVSMRIPSLVLSVALENNKGYFIFAFWCFLTAF